MRESRRDEMRKGNKKLNLDELSDKELVEKFKKGSVEAFDILVRRYESKAFNLAMSFTRNQEDAEEVLQDVFVTVYRKIDGFQGKSAFSSWLYRITVNASFMKLRKNKQDKSMAVEEITPAMESAWMEKDARSTRSCEDNAANDELKSMLSKAINKLPDEYRAVFILRDVDGLSNKETGEILDLTVPAVKSRLHRARLMLRKKLQRYYDDYVNPTQILGIGHRYLQEVA